MPFLCWENCSRKSSHVKAYWLCSKISPDANYEMVRGGGGVVLPFLRISCQKRYTHLNLLKLKIFLIDFLVIHVLVYSTDLKFSVN